jgi:putative membrane protein
MSMRSLMASAAGGMVLTVGASLNPLPAQSSTAQQQFVSQVAAENLLEVRLGEAARQRAMNPSVKQFAQRMVMDHTSMQKQWMAVARNNNIEFKADLSPRQVQQAGQLGTLKGAEFDRAYMSLMVQNHQEAVSNFQTQRNSNYPADMRQLIETGLPLLQEHLRTAQQISGQVGGGVATTGGQTDTTAVATQQPGQTTSTPSGQALNVRADSVFIGEVNQSNAHELRLARLAESKASADVVRRFAQKMRTDHTLMQKEWAGVSASIGTRISAANPRRQEEIRHLERQSGPEFDRAYMAAMVENHREAVNAFQVGRGTARSPEVRQLVARSLPYLQEHLTLAQQIARQVGSDTTVATISGDTDEDEREPGQSGNLNKDRKYIQNVYAHHNMEIALGELAQKRSRDEAVRQFGRRMVQDHSALRKQWLALIPDEMRSGPGMGPLHREKIDYLERFSGREFDREYMTLMTKHHRRYVSAFHREARGANSARVRQRANRAIPMLEQHFQQAKQIGGRVGADTITVRVGPLSAKQR